MECMFSALLSIQSKPKMRCISFSDPLGTNSAEVVCGSLGAVWQLVGPGRCGRGAEGPLVGACPDDSDSRGVASLLLNASPALLGRFCFYLSRANQPRHDIAQQEVQPEDRRSQIIGVGSRLAIQPVPTGDQARECQPKLALRCRENLPGSRPVKRDHVSRFGPCGRCR